MFFLQGGPLGWLSGARRSSRQIARRVGRPGLEARVLDGRADREVVEAAPAARGEPRDLVHGLVEEAADARASQSERLGLEVEHLSHSAALPEEPRVEPRAVALERGVEV